MNKLNNYMKTMREEMKMNNQESLMDKMNGNNNIQIVN